MDALGRQLLVEYYDCNQEKINDVELITSEMITATLASGATIISHNFHKFSPFGVSGVVVIAESHVSLHSWPEYNYVALDIFTCGNSIDPNVILQSLKESFEAGNVTCMEMKRGIFQVNPGEKLTFKPSKSVSGSIIGK